MELVSCLPRGLSKQAMAEIADDAPVATNAITTRKQ